MTLAAREAIYIGRPFRIYRNGTLCLQARQLEGCSASFTLHACATHDHRDIGILHYPGSQWKGHGAEWQMERRTDVVQTGAPFGGNAA
jgi:hypothetical protein